MESDTSQKLRARLRRLRLGQGLTQEQFAEAAGLSYKYYQEVETGRKKDLRLSTVERLAKSYGISVYQLFAPGDPKVRLQPLKGGRPHKPRQPKA